jgi:predicted DCC family thiol-disulfide oxidoreductase YuxK
MNMPVARKRMEQELTGITKDPAYQGTILFDGVCNLCERSVQFVIRHDPGAKFSFAPLQSVYARTLLEDLEPGFQGLLASDPDSFILIAAGRVEFRSDAWLAICSQLDGWPVFLGTFRVVPRFIRDAVYDFVGRRRYRWFGKKSECMIPTPDIQQRFRR